MKRTLILACSATKARNPRPIPAMHRYIGPAWKTLLANIEASEARHGQIELFALSAKFGLISAMKPIPDYDDAMTMPMGQALIPSVAAELERLGRAGELGERILFYGGAHYRACIIGARDLAQIALDRAIPIVATRGGIGEQLAQLKAWLIEEKQS